MANWKLKLKHSLNKITGKYNHLNTQVNCPKQWYGNEYGGFYVNPDLIQSGSIVYSFGIGEDISFDLAMMKTHQSIVFAFDPTPKSIKWIAKNGPKQDFHFYDYGIGATTGTTFFHLPKNPDHVSRSTVLQENVSETEKVEVLMKSFADIAEELQHKKIDVLKMDIEGSEYEVLDSILATPVQITQVLIEFHERFFENGKQKTVDFIAKMNAKGYAIFAVSDSFEEISFILKSELK